jgi:hypothetical protein
MPLAGAQACLLYQGFGEDTSMRKLHGERSQPADNHILRATSPIVCVVLEAVLGSVSL